MSSAISTAANTSTGSTAGSALITSTGIGSGLNISSIVSALTTAQGAAQNNALAARQTSLNAQVSAYGTFSSALSTLQATLSTLETPSQLAGFTATVADNTIASASSTSSAVAGQYSLQVQNLATSASLSSQPVAGSSTAIGTGTLTIAVGGSSTAITIDSSNNTLAGIVAAINGATNNPGVSASILTTTAGSRLVLSGAATGAGNSITVSQSGGDGGLSVLAYDPTTATTTTTGGVTTSTTAGGLTQTQAAQDANFSINGYPATSSSNQVTSAISGVTVNLLKVTAANTPTTLTISPDTQAAQTSIGTFTKALNGLLTSIQSLTSYDPTTQTAGPLLGNATLESFRNQLSSILNKVTSSASGGSVSLASIGIRANVQGTYDTNSTTLGNSLSSNLASIGNLLGGATGIATQLNTLVTGYTQSGGLLDTNNKGLNASLSDVSTQQTALNARLATFSATLTKEYNAMDTAVALLKQTQTYLTAQFNPSSSSSSSSSSSTSLGSGTLSTGG
ncbi:MAG: flagellar hook-associated protein 2 [Gammaproteobacteria bacterium]|nr:flagellar hook-associated protein 2 [Gammaproteobacteria bacterium]